MLNEKKVEAPNAKLNATPISSEKTGVGISLASPVEIVLLIIYLIALSLLLLHGLIQFLPEKLATEGAVANVSTIKYLNLSLQITEEIRLFVIVALAGSLGSLVHAFRSLYWYIGNRSLVRSWIPKYILMPFIGTTLAVTFYLVIRGGFFSAGGDVNQTNPYGFTALGALIGMFSEQAVLKLKEVAETLLSKPQPGTDSKPEMKSNGSEEKKES